MTDFQDIHDIVRELNAALGTTLVAGLSGSKDRRLPVRWAKADGPEPRPEAARRLTFAHRQWRLLAAADGAQVARQWFIGGNPHLSENTPITAIREDRHDEVAGAVESFIGGPAELSRRALDALEDAEDAQQAGEILSRIESGQERTYTMAEVTAELRSVNAVAADIPDIVGRLRTVLGGDVVAVLVKRTPRTVTRWMAGEAEPPAREEVLLRDAFQITQLLSEVEPDEVIRAWFMGMNPQLGDDSPVEALREGRVRAAMAAARSFVDAG